MIANRSKIFFILCLFCAIFHQTVVYVVVNTIHILTFLLIFISGMIVALWVSNRKSKRFIPKIDKENPEETLSTAQTAVVIN